MAPKLPYGEEGFFIYGEAVVDDVADTIVGAPRIFADLLKTEWNAALKPTAYGGGSYDSTVMVALGEVSSFTGVAAGIDINPQNIAKDPEKWATKTLQNWFWTGGVLNFSDFALKYEKEFYRRLIYDQDKLYGDLVNVAGVTYGPVGVGLLKSWKRPEFDDTSLDIKKRVIAAGMTSDFIDTTPLSNGVTGTIALDDPETGMTGAAVIRQSQPTDPAPLVVGDLSDVDGAPTIVVDPGQVAADSSITLDGGITSPPSVTIVSDTTFGPVYTHYIYEEDLVANFAAAVDDFVAKDKIALYRESSYRKVQFASFDIYREVITPDKSGVMNSPVYKKTIPTDPTTGLPLPGPVVVDVAISATPPNIVSAFSLKVDVAEKLNVAETAMGDFSTGLGNFIAWRGNTQGLSKSSVQDMQVNLSKVRGGFVELFGGVNDKGVKVDSFVNQIRDMYGAGSAERIAFDRVVKPLEDYYDKLQKSGLLNHTLQTAADGSVFAEYDVVRRLTNFNSLGVVKSESEIASLMMFKAQLDSMKKQFSGGLVDGPVKVFFKHLELEITDTNSVINKYVRAKGVNLNGFSDVLKVMSRKRRWEEAGELLQQFEKGNLTSYLFWFNGLQLRNWVALATPAFFIKTYLLERTHYFGLLVQDTSKVKTYGIFDNMVNNWGIFRNDFVVEWGGMTVQAVGGAHFQVLLNLNKNFKKGLFGATVAKDGSISFADGGKAFVAILNARSADEMLKLAGKYGIVLPVKDQAALVKFYEELQVLKNYLKNHPIFGKAFFDAKGNFMLSAVPGFSSLTTSLWKMEGLAHFTDITRASMGLLEKLSVKLSYLQHQIFSKIPGGSYIGKFLTLKTAISEAIATAIAGALNALSGGFLTPIMAVVQKVIAVVVRKVVDTTTKAFKVLIKGRVDEFFKIFEDMFTGIAKAFGMVFAGIGIVFLMGVLIITTVLSGIQPKIPAKGTPLEHMYGQAPVNPGSPISNLNCSLDPQNDVPPSTGLPVPTNPIALRAYNIVENLRAGFWCYWNFSPDYYPGTFNMTLFNQHPYHCVYENNNPAGCTGNYRDLWSATVLFWCTQLTVKSYTENGMGYGPIYGAHLTAQNFRQRGRFIEAAEDVRGRVRPGDILFTHTSANAQSEGWIGHVSIIHSVSQDFIITIDSNASSKVHNYTISQNGRVQSDQSYLFFAGIGMQ